MGRALILGTFLGLCSAGLRAASTAEAYWEFFGGTARVHRADYTLAQNGGPIVRGTAGGGGAQTTGLRFGFWAPGTVSCGAGLDFIGFKIDTPAVTGEAYPLSFFLSARLPLARGPRFPAGRLQPYAMIGMSSVILRATVKSPALSANLRQGIVPVPIGAGDPRRAIWAPYVVAGLSLGLGPDWFIFGEWRRIDFRADAETVDNIWWPTRHGRIDLSIQNNLYCLGLSRRFLIRPKPKPAPQASAGN